MMDKPTRINKFISSCTTLSRRKVDEYILQGRITINGYTIYDPGYIINPAEHKVAVDGELIRASMRKIYILMNKPTKVITAVTDDKGRPTVMDVLGERLNVFPVGRLDYDTSGFLIMTNDGDLANELMNPKFKVTKTYEVALSKPLDNKHRLLLMKGIVLDGYKTRPCYINLKGKFSTNTVFITLVEGKTRQVRRMFEHFGYFVNKLERIKYGHMKLGSLSTGQWRYMSTEEVNNLRKVIEMGINENFISESHIPKKVNVEPQEVPEVPEVTETEEKPAKTAKAKKTTKTAKTEKEEKPKKETKTKKATSGKSKKNDKPEMDEPEKVELEMDEPEIIEQERVEQEDEEINVDAIDYFDEDDDFDLVSEDAPVEEKFNKKIPKESIEVDDYGEINFNRIENFADDGGANIFSSSYKPTKKQKKSFNKIDSEVNGNKLIPGELPAKKFENPYTKSSESNSEDEINYNRIENNVFEKGEDFSRKAAKPSHRGGSYPQKSGSYSQKSGSYPQKSGSYPQKSGSYPQKSGSYSQKSGSYPQKSGGSFQKDGNSYQKDGNSYQKSGSYPQKSGSYPQKSGSSFQKDGNSFQKSGSYSQKDGNFKKKDGSFIKKDYEFKRVEINPVKKETNSNANNSNNTSENFNKKENNFNREGFNVVYSSDNNKWKPPQQKRTSFSKPHSNIHSNTHSNTHSNNYSKPHTKPLAKRNPFKEPSKLPSKIAKVVQNPKYIIDENGEKNFNTIGLENSSNIMNFYESEKKYKNIYDYEQRTDRPGKKKTGGTRGAKKPRR